MKCPYCGDEESKVIDSRPTEDGERIRRRRECLRCHMRFTTYEVVETVPLIVIKKDNSREPFDRQKLLNAMLRACAKRPVSYEALERAVSSIEQSLMSSYDREVTSVRIGELTMQELKKIDEVAYVRFASVYQQFADVESFFNELKKLMGDRKYRKSRVGFRTICSGAGTAFLFACSEDPPGQPFHRLHLDLCPAQLPKGLLGGVHFQVAVCRAERGFQLCKILGAEQVVHVHPHLVTQVSPMGQCLAGGCEILIPDGFHGGVNVRKNLLGKVLYFPAAVKSCHQ